MELKFLVFTFLVLFAAFGCIESRRSSGRSSSSRGSSSRGSSSRGSSSYGSSSRGSSSGHSSSYGSSRPSSSSYGSGHSSNSRTGSSSHNTGSFLTSERVHSTSTGNRPTGSRTNTQGSQSPHRPFGTVPPPPKHTGSQSPHRPFGTVPPPPKHTGSQSPHRPFATVPPPKINGSPRPATPPPGINLPHSNIQPSAPPAGPHSIFQLPDPIHYIYPRQPPRNHAFSNSKNHSAGHGSSAPGAGWNIPGSNNRPTGTFPPPPPIKPTNYPTQGSNPTLYPRQPPYNPAYPNLGNQSPGHGSSAPGAGSNIPGSNNRPTGTFPPPPPIKPTNYPTQGSNPILYPRQPPYNPAYPNLGNQSPGHGSSAPGAGWNIPGSNNRPTGTFPQPPIQPTHYPTQGGHYGGSVSGQNHPIVNQPPPFYSPYPGHHPTNGYINPVQTHVVHHTLPPNPVQTVVVVPGQSGYHRSTGDIFKEAIIHAGVNAAVHRITSPSYYGHYHSSNSWNTNNGFPPQGQSSVSTTNTHIVNNNYYPGSTGNVAGQSNPVPPNNNPQFYPGDGVQSGSVNGFNSGNPVNYPNSGSSSSPGSGVSQIPTNGQSRPHQNNENGLVNNGYITILDQELLNITEKLFSLDENNASEFIFLNLQKQVEANKTNITDESLQPLFTVQPAAYNIPTIRAIRTLYRAAAEIENKTREDSRREEALFVDLILNTNVMTAAMDFLTRKNLIKNDYYAHRDMLKYLWFTTYDGSSSAFKRVFQGEIYEGFLWGIQDWIAFDFQEKSGRANYFSYVNKTDLGKSSPNTAILKANFHMNGNMKTGTALFVGISPELQMALYTICYHTRRDNYCNVSLGGTQVKIYTHAGRYFGDDLIDVAFPIL